MSICSNTLRALSRSRISTSTTLLPFLYHTATIRHWTPAARPTACRTFTSRSNDGDHIPFEDDSLPPAIDQVQPARKSTITGSERAAFRKLYKTFNTQGRPRSDDEHVVELDQIADEYYEDDEEPRAKSLDQVFDDVLTGRIVTPGAMAKSKKLGQDSPAPPEESPSSRPSPAQSKKKDARAEAARIKQLKLAERERVDTLLQTAHTDRALWQTLEREVLDQVRKLDLDGTKKPTEPPPSKPNRKAQKTDPTASDPRILFQNYPHHLITALVTLRTAFPASPLPSALLPAIKALGRSSYALGATTTLYKHLLRTAWLQHSSYAHIDALLIDMNNGAIEFDSGILEVLDAVIKEHDLARSGTLGREMQMVYGMEQFLEGIQKVRQWRGVVAERLGIVVEERRAQQRVVRRAEQERRGGDADAFRPPRHESGGKRERVGITGSSAAEGGPLLQRQQPGFVGVDAQEKRDAELLVEEMGLNDA